MKPMTALIMPIIFASLQWHRPMSHGVVRGGVMDVVRFSEEMSSKVLVGLGTSCKGSVSSKIYCFSYVYKDHILHALHGKGTVK